MGVVYSIKFVLRAVIATAACTAGFILVSIGWDPVVLQLLGLGLVAFGAIVVTELVQESLT